MLTRRSSSEDGQTLLECWGHLISLRSTCLSVRDIRISCVSVVRTTAAAAEAMNASQMKTCVDVDSMRVVGLIAIPLWVIGQLMLTPFSFSIYQYVVQAHHVALLPYMSAYVHPVKERART